MVGIEIDGMIKVRHRAFEQRSAPMAKCEVVMVIGISGFQGNRFFVILLRKRQALLQRVVEVGASGSETGVTGARVGIQRYGPLQEIDRLGMPRHAMKYHAQLMVGPKCSGVSPISRRYDASALSSWSVSIKIRDKLCCAGSNKGSRASARAQLAIAGAFSFACRWLVAATKMQLCRRRKHRESRVANLRSLPRHRMALPSPARWQRDS
jgi:hypothetical protein